MRCDPSSVSRTLFLMGAQDAEQQFLLQNHFQNLLETNFKDKYCYFAMQFQPTTGEK